MDRNREDIDEEGLPNRNGVYLAKGIWGSDEPKEIEVYVHQIKGLSCWADDYGGEVTNGITFDETDCHVSVKNTGLEFISRVRDLS